MSSTRRLRRRVLRWERYARRIGTDPCDFWMVPNGHLRAVDALDNERARRGLRHLRDQPAPFGRQPDTDRNPPCPSDPYGEHECSPEVRALDAANDQSWLDALDGPFGQRDINQQRMRLLYGGPPSDPDTESTS